MEGSGFPGAESGVIVAWKLRLPLAARRLAARRNSAKLARVETAGFILAGGKSSRMGAEKAELRLQGRSLLELAREKLQAVTPKVFVVGPKTKFGSQAIEDVFPDHGPLGGIHAALTSSAAALNLMLAVDLPQLPATLLQYLLHEADCSKAIVVVPRIAGGWQPLCAVYRRAFLPIATVALEAGRNKIDALFNNLQLRIVDEEELIQAGFSAAHFENLNTPEELEQARSRPSGPGESHA
jgi:molybdenum cofactor guanylyltransferase